MYFFLSIVVLTLASPAAHAQGAAGNASANPATDKTSAQNQSGSARSWFTRRSVEPGTTYVRPTESQKFHNFLFDALGPYPILASAVTAGAQQAYNSPPEWGQGGAAYFQRFGSNYGISLITTSSRYALAEAFREDTIYYRCSCKGILPRTEHALISTVTARRGADGHRVFSFAALAAPYAGTITAVTAWYPGRYEPLDGVRIGNYNLLYQAAGNLALEFVWGGPHTLLSHTPLSSIVGKSSEKNSSH